MLYPQRIILLMLAVFCVAFLAACGGGEPLDGLAVIGPSDPNYCPPDLTVFVGPVQAHCLPGKPG